MSISNSSESSELNRFDAVMRKILSVSKVGVAQTIVLILL